MKKSDLPIYILGLFLGLCAGALEVSLGDFLLMSLFVAASTFVLATIRPHRPWRWMLVVAVCVPLAEFAAYLFLGRRFYRVQIWESGLGFVTGTVGAYAGSFARKAANELFPGEPRTPPTS